eukprot:gene3524-665_t
MSPELMVLPATSTSQLAPTAITYNALINACKDCKRPQDALRAFERMQTKGVLPDRFTFTALIAACGKAGWSQEAMAVYRRMEHHGVQPDTPVMNAVLSSCTSWDAAGPLYQDMLSSGLSPTTITYVALMRLSPNLELALKLLEQAQVDQMVQVLAAMEASGVAPDSITINTLLRYDHGQSVKDLLERMTLLGIRPDAYTYTSAYRKCADSVELRWVQEHMCVNYVTNPPAEVYNALFAACLRIKDMALAQQAEAGIQPEMSLSATSYVALLKASAQACDLVWTKRVYNRMDADLPSGTADSSQAYLAAVSAFSNCVYPDGVLAVHQRMKELCLDIDCNDSAAASALIIANLGQGNTAEALWLYYKSVSSGVVPWEPAIQALCGRYGSLLMVHSELLSVYSGDTSLPSQLEIIQSAADGDTDAAFSMTMPPSNTAVHICSLYAEGFLHFSLISVAVFDDQQQRHGQVPVSTYSLLLSLCAPKRPDSALKILDDMRKRHLLYKPPTLEAALKGSSPQYLDLCIQVYEDMQGFGIQ